MNEFWDGLRPTRVIERHLDDPPRPGWRMLFVFYGDILDWIWRRGIYLPVVERVDRVLWRLGVGAHRYPVRVGGWVRVHGLPEVVRSVDWRARTVTTLTGTHDLVHCCDPDEPARVRTWWDWVKLAAAVIIGVIMLLTVLSLIGVVD